MVDGLRGRRGEKGDKGEPGEDAPLVQLTELLRDERRRWRAWFAGLVIVVAGLGLLGAQAVRASEERARLACETRQDYRHVIREIVAYVSAPEPAGSGLNLTVVDGFDGLDEPMRAYLTRVSERLTAGDPDGDQEFRAFVDPLLPSEAC